MNPVIIEESMETGAETIRKAAPTIHKATNTIGPQAIFSLLADFLQASSALLAETCSTYAQLSVGSYVEDWTLCPPR